MSLCCIISGVEKGESITIVRSGRVMRVHFVGIETWSGHACLTYMPYTRTSETRPPVIGNRLDEENVTWARGHSGPAVDALLAAEALR